MIGPKIEMGPTEIHEVPRFSPTRSAVRSDVQGISEVILRVMKTDDVDEWRDDDG